MINIYKSTEAGLQKQDEIVNGCWVNVVDPSPAEIAQLVEQGVPQDFITYSLDVDERPRSEREDEGQILILLRVPFFQGVKVDIPYTTLPVGIILTDRLIVTVTRWNNDMISELASGRVRGLSTGKRNRFVLRVLLNTASKYLTYLREINKITEGLEDKLTASMQNKEVMELLKYQKSLVYFTTALKSNELMMERLQRGQFFHMYPDDEDLLEDVITENQQAIEMVNISSNILAGMMDAFASIISNNLNVVMKFLASITIVLSIPGIIFGFFGMNVMIPFAEQPWAYLGILILGIVATLAVVLMFRKRDWF